MTICEKFEMMLSNFANIKTALENRGVTVGDGYTSYAKGVHDILGDDYTPQCTYPSDGDIYDKVLSCKDIKEEIRQAIIDCGVDVAEDEPLSEYADKIAQIQQLTIGKVYVNTEYDTEINIQLEATGGKPPYTWEFINNAFVPDGIKLSSDGVLSGKTSVANCSYSNVGYRVTDSRGHTTEKTSYITIFRKTLVFEIVGDSAFTYDGEPHTVELRCTNVPDVEFTATYGGDAAAINCGSYRIQPVPVDTKHYQANSPGYITINAATLIIDTKTDERYKDYYRGSIAIQTYAYDGQTHEFDFDTIPAELKQYVTIRYLPDDTTQKMSNGLPVGKGRYYAYFSLDRSKCNYNYAIKGEIGLGGDEKNCATLKIE